MHFDDSTEQDMVEAIARLRKAELTVKEAKVYIQDRMGDAEEMIVGSHRVTWKTTKGRATTDWRTIVLKLNASALMIEQHTATGKPSRRFDIR